MNDINQTCIKGRKYSVLMGDLGPVKIDDIIWLSHSAHHIQ